MPLPVLNSASSPVVMGVVGGIVPLKTIHRIEFTLLDDEAVRELTSSVPVPNDAERKRAPRDRHITSAELWDFSTNSPHPNGLLSTALGAVSREHPCTTCEGVSHLDKEFTLSDEMIVVRKSECVGHIGYADLALPVYTPITIDIALALLRVHCVHCGVLLLRDASTALPAFVATQRANGCDAPLTLLQALAKHIGAMKSCLVCKFRLPSLKMVPPKSATGADDVSRSRSRSPFYIEANYDVSSRLTPEQLSADTVLERLMGSSRCFRVLPLRTEATIHAIIRNDNFSLLVNTVWRGDRECALSFVRSATTRLFIVPPPCARPFTVPPISDGDASDEVQQMLRVMRASDTLSVACENLSLPSSIDDFSSECPGEFFWGEHYEALQYSINVLYDAKTYASAQPVKLPQRMRITDKQMGRRNLIDKKGGRLRWNLMGKRTDFSARTVVTPDPLLPIDVCGVPRSIADTLTVPVRVTVHSLKACCELLTTSAARVLIFPDGRKRRDLADRPYELEKEGPPNIDAVIERRLRDGDVVLLNRQPSLHRPSVMAFRVRVMDYSSIRVPVEDTTPFNMDFDGDEANLHVPQSLDAQVEALQLMAVQRQILLPATNRPVMGFVQDQLLMARIMTLRDTFLDCATAMQLLFASAGGNAEHTQPSTLPVPAIVKSPMGPHWTGKQLVSTTIPAHINRCSQKWRSDDPSFLDATDSALLIVSGVLLGGSLSKSSVGVADSSLQHSIATTVHKKSVQGNEVAADTIAREVAVFFDSLKLMCGEFAMHEGFSVGLGDMMLSNDNERSNYTPTSRTPSVRRSRARAALAATSRRKPNFSDGAAEVRQARNQAKIDADEILENISYLEKDGDMNKLIDRVEQRLLASAAEATAEASKIAISDLRTSNPRNALNEMTDAGSKGIELNQRQIAACVGQQQRGISRIVDTDLLRVAPRTDAVPTRRLIFPSLWRSLPHDRNPLDEVRDVVTSLSELCKYEKLPPPNETASARKRAMWKITVPTRRRVFPPLRHSHDILSELCKHENPLPNKTELPRKKVIMGPFVREKVEFFEKQHRKAIMEAKVPKWVALSAELRKKILASMPRVYPGATEGGNCENSFIDGLTPREFFYHAMGGREGLIDTAVKTKETGYSSRRLMKAMEDIVYAYDSTLRNCAQRLMGPANTFCSHPERRRKKDFVEIGWSRAQYEQFLLWPTSLASGVLDGAHDPRSLSAAIARERAAIISARDGLRALFSRELSGATQSLRLYTPLPLDELLNAVVTSDDPLRRRRCAVVSMNYFESTHGSQSSDVCTCPPSECCRDAPAMLGARRADVLTVIAGVDALIVRLRAAKLLCGEPHEAELRICLASKRLVGAINMTLGEFGDLLDRLERGCRAAVCEPGDAIGVMAAQSLGQYTQQLTLNTFHGAGSEKGSISGVPRLIELLMGSSSESIKGPLIRIAVSPNPVNMPLLMSCSARLLCRSLVRACCTVHSDEPLTRVLAQLGHWRPQFSDSTDVWERALVDDHYDFLGWFGPAISRVALEEARARECVRMWRRTPLDEPQKKREIGLRAADCAFLKRGTESPWHQYAHVGELDDAFSPPCVGAAECDDRLEHQSCIGSAVLSLVIDGSFFIHVPVNITSDEFVAALFASVNDNLSCRFIVWTSLRDGDANTGNVLVRIRVRRCAQLRHERMLEAKERKRNKEDVQTTPLRKLEKEAEIAALVELRRVLERTCVSPLSDGADALLSSTETYIVDPNSGAFVARSHEIVVTSSRNFLAALTLDNTNWRLTLTNNVDAVVHVLGVEAALGVLVGELEDVVVRNAGYIDRSHLQLIADVMFAGGSWASFTRTGMPSLHNDVLTHATFETGSAVLARAAINNITTKVFSPSSTIMTGQSLRSIGTGAFDLLLDSDAILRDAIELPDGELMRDEIVRMRVAEKRIRLEQGTFALSPRAVPEREVVRRRQRRAPLSLNFGAAPKRDHSDAFSFTPDGLEEDDFDDYDDVIHKTPRRADPNDYADFSAFDLDACDAPMSPMVVAPAPMAPWLDAAEASCFSPLHGNSETYSPTSSPRWSSNPGMEYSPSSPLLSPSSPSWSPSSPSYSPSSASYSPSSANYSPSSPSYSPSNASYSPSHPAPYSPTSPRWKGDTPYSPSSSDGEVPLRESATMTQLDKELVSVVGNHSAVLVDEKTATMAFSPKFSL